METSHPLSAPRALRPFRFGVIAAAARSADDWVTKARRAESLGYATLVIPDNLQYTLAPLPDAGRGPRRYPAKHIWPAGLGPHIALVWRTIINPRLSTAFRKFRVLYEAHVILSLRRIRNSGAVNRMRILRSSG